MYIYIYNISTYTEAHKQTLAANVLFECGMAHPKRSIKSLWLWKSPGSLWRWKLEIIRGTTPGQNFIGPSSPTPLIWQTRIIASPKIEQSFIYITRPGKPTKKLWKITMFHGKIHYFHGDFPYFFVGLPGRVILLWSRRCWYSPFWILSKKRWRCFTMMNS